MPLYEPVTTTVSSAQNDFRLTGVTATPVMTANSTTLSTIFLTPYIGATIALYNGASWDLLTSVEVSLAVTGRTTDLLFDIFGYNNAGVVTLEFLNWTNSTTRATGLTRQDGVWCQTGDLTRRYLGTCRPRSATTYHWVLDGIDAPAKMDLWNAGNRVLAPFRCIATTDSWNYTTATWRQAQASTNYQVDVVAGLQEEALDATLLVSVANALTTSSVEVEVGLGYDSTTAPSGIFGSFSVGSGYLRTVTGMFTKLIGIGRHFVAWLEISSVNSQTTWYGDNGAARLQSGISGTWSC